MWEIYWGRLKAPEDTIMEIALERGIEDGPASQGYADSDKNGMLFQTSGPPSPIRALFFPR